MNKTAYLGLIILEISKIVMYKFCQDYVKTKYGENENLYHMDTDSFIVHIKAEDIYVDIAEDVETRLDSEVNLFLTLSANCVIFEINRETTFAIADT